MDLESEGHISITIGAVWILLLSLILYLAYLPVDITSYEIIGPFLLAVMIILDRLFPHNGLPRVLFLAFAGFLTLRYILWRTFFTIHYHGMASFIAAIILYLAEVYGIILFLIGAFVNVRPLRRKILPMPPEKDLPTVDIFIPSLDESPQLLKNTILAAQNIDYPKDKLQIYLLDDGSTLERRHTQDLLIAQQAKKRHHTLKKLCKEVGINYLTRENNQHAKAGNLNEALKKTAGDLILVLDADHIPAKDILTSTVAWFVKDKNLAILQTPHFFVNPDPIEKNLGTFSIMPSENEMFYMAIQPGLDFWNSSFFCGSAALLKRSALEDVGGIGGSSITEDAETAIELHSIGYNSAYISKPLVAGLQPETFSSFIKQRMRWAQGMIQIFILKNPLLKKGLRIYQRLCYTNSGIFWFFSYARVILLLAPSAFLIFGLKIYDANVPHVIAYAGPYILGTMICTNYIYGEVRWPFISELYEIMQSFFNLPAITKAIINPRKPTFKVTPKGENLAKDFISPLSPPFYMMFSIIVISLLLGLYRYIWYPVDRNLLIITGVWEVFNFFLFLGVLGALLERKQVRAAPRIYAGDLIATCVTNGDTVRMKVKDISVGGASLYIPDANRFPGRGEIKIYSPTLDEEETFSFETVHYSKTGTQASNTIGIRFYLNNTDEERRLISLIYGDSNRWTEILKQREKRLGIFRAIIFLIKTGGTYTIKHLFTILRSGIRNITTYTIKLWACALYNKAKQFNT